MYISRKNDLYIVHTYICSIKFTYISLIFWVLKFLLVLIYSFWLRVLLVLNILCDIVFVLYLHSIFTIIIKHFKVYNDR